MAKRVNLYGEETLFYLGNILFSWPIDFVDNN
jgi:hypothetical protein